MPSGQIGQTRSVTPQDRERPPRVDLGVVAEVAWRLGLVIAGGFVLIAVLRLLVALGWLHPYSGPGPLNRLPPRSVPVPYAGEFRYASAGTDRVWCVSEYVSVSIDVLSYLEPGVSGARTRRRVPTATTARQHRLCAERYGQRWRIRSRRVPSRGVSGLLGPQWTYAGIRGIGKRIDRVYRRARVEPLVLRQGAAGPHVAVDEVALPGILLGTAMLVPDETSTIRFQGPKGVLRATSPPASAKNFAGENSFTIRLGELAKAGENPRVAFTSDPPRRTFGSRIAAWSSAGLTTLAGWFTSLLGVCITTMVTVGLGIVIERRWRARREPEDDPEPPTLVLPDGTAADAPPARGPLWNRRR